MMDDCVYTLPCHGRKALFIRCKKGGCDDYVIDKTKCAERVHLFLITQCSIPTVVLKMDSLMNRM